MDETASPVYTTLTIYRKRTRTIWACPSTVTNCPVTRVTTIDVPLYTTVCPVTPVSTQAAETSVAPDSKTVTITVKVIMTYLVDSCPPTVSNCPLGSVGTTAAIKTLYSGPSCSLKDAMARPSDAPGVHGPDPEDKSKKAPVPNGSPKAPGRVPHEPKGADPNDTRESSDPEKEEELITSKVTRVITITSCPPTITRCPVGKVTTTVVTETHRNPKPTIQPSPSSDRKPDANGPPISHQTPDIDKGREEEMPDMEEPPKVKVTRVITIASCAPTITNCPMGSMTTIVTERPCSGHECSGPTASPQPPPSRPEGQSSSSRVTAQGPRKTDPAKCPGCKEKETNKEVPPEKEPLREAPKKDHQVPPKDPAPAPKGHEPKKDEPVRETPKGHVPSKEEPGTAEAPKKNHDDPPAPKNNDPPAPKNNDPPAPKGGFEEPHQPSRAKVAPASTEEHAAPEGKVKPAEKAPDPAEPKSHPISAPPAPAVAFNCVGPECQAGGTAGPKGCVGNECRELTSGASRLGAGALTALCWAITMLL
ncbi:hypothetical protein CDD83_7162 [Cordyceps sp. RAO-2017]|nr:hypothetical protein CDD83_7162 [Cordyceps sp. RAO-2017]